MKDKMIDRMNEHKFISELFDCLIEEKKLIKKWFCIRMDEGTGRLMWDVYDNNSPEMARLNKKIEEAQKLFESYFKPLYSDGIQIIFCERLRQIKVEGFGSERDDKYVDGSLALAAACYAVAEDAREHYKDETIPGFWPESWDDQWWKPTPNDRIRELAKAGALIAAEIDRLKRKLPNA